jgi:hypothetical protein
VGNGCKCDFIQVTGANNRLEGFQGEFLEIRGLSTELVDMEFEEFDNQEAAQFVNDDAHAIP